MLVTLGFLLAIAIFAFSFHASRKVDRLLPKYMKKYSQYE